MFSKAESITMKLGGIHDTTDRRVAAQVLREIPGVRTVSVRQDAAERKTTIPAATVGARTRKRP